MQGTRVMTDWPYTGLSLLFLVLLRGLRSICFDAFPLA